MGVQFLDQSQAQIVIGTDSTNVFPFHIHQSFCMGLVDRGVRRITTRTTSILVPAGSLFLLNPDQPHTCQSEGDAGHSYRTLCVSADRLRILTGHISEKPPFLPHFNSIRLDDSRLLRALQIVLAANTALEQESALIDLLSDLIMRYADQRPVIYPVGPQRESIQRTIDYIQAHYADKITLDDLALLAALSPYHFQRVFQKQTGLSPHEYLTQVRIKNSQIHLREGMPLADVALMVGFSDQSHFTRCFERVMGLSPGKFVRQIARSANRTRLESNPIERR